MELGTASFLVGFSIISEGEPQCHEENLNHSKLAQDCVARKIQAMNNKPVSYTHLTLPTNREV